MITTTKNTPENNIAASTNSTLKGSLISNIENGKAKTTDFLVFATDGISDWVTKLKFDEINSLFAESSYDTDSGLDFPLKLARKGNADEGRESVEGKALQIIEEEDFMVINVYTQAHGSSWKFSHTHKIGLALYNAYSVASLNTKKVLAAEKIE